MNTADQRVSGGEKEGEAMRLTPNQQSVIETLATTDWSIRREFCGADLRIYYWGAPTLKSINLRVFTCLCSKRLIERYDSALNLWGLSKAGRQLASETPAAALSKRQVQRDRRAIRAGGKWGRAQGR